jgi:hypothetical protein
VITDLILSVVFAPIIFVLNLIPAIDLGSMFSTGVAGSAGSISTVGQAGFWLGTHFADLGRWTNIPVALTVMTAVATAWGFYLVVKVSRLILSLVTGGGGT